ncbi:IS110 family transposase [Parahaliea aestuarii]|uniref:IS110 family transposase n=1 Tax=Parahaliea aestuarii TaxID=1852021 RepID=A0A5C8ZMS5_9GAMM|nr:IS110 family transposase [Parahaliea aestuarii]TXS89040.1 IS110 family transposase [Parahaliea aestuarii]
MKKIARVGIDIAKQVFLIHGVDVVGATVLKKKLRRKEVLSFFAQLPATEIGIEACGGSHYWARELGKLSHTVRLISPHFVTPYRRKGKNDANDAEAICEAISRPGMNFVAVKSEGQQSILMAHRVREQLVSDRTSLINQMRGHMMEFGVVLPMGRRRFQKTITDALAEDLLPKLVVTMLHEMLVRLSRLDDEISNLDTRIESWARQDEIACRLMKLDGIGPLSASALVATAGNGSVFKNGRQFSAWLGLVPRQYSSGGRNKLGAITKKGDRYLRKLLVQGARTVLLMASREKGSHCKWIQSLRERRPDNVVAVAMASKQARMAWAVMTNSHQIEPAM